MAIQAIRRTATAREQGIALDWMKLENCFMSGQVSTATSRVARWSLMTAMLMAGYVLSSGPVLAIGFRLREATGWDGFYVVMLLYYPLLAFGRDNPISTYIEWWVVDVFDTVGPG